MTIFGVDVSKWQGPDLDWGRIHASGIEFMLARASLATTPDPHYARNQRRAHEAGIAVRGAYHFLYPAKVVPPAAQARLFVDLVGDPAGLLTMLDVERDGRQRPDVDDARAFAEEFRSLTRGHPLLMYAPAWYWDVLGDPPAADLGPLVASHYVPVDRNEKGRPIRMAPEEAYARVPTGWWRARHGGWTRATILQFTSSGKVPGHRGAIDVNAFKGGVAGLVALAGSQPARPVSPARPSAPVPSAPARRGVPARPTTPPGRFHVVVAGDTLSGIAARFGWKAKGGRPAFRVMLEAFDENRRFRATPDLIHPGDRVRVG